MMLLNSSTASVGTTNWYCSETRRTVGAVPFAEHVERVVELRQVLDLAAIGAGLAVPQLADRPESVLVGQPVGEQVRQRKQLRRIEFQRIALQLLGQLVERGQRARATPPRGPASAER